MAVVPQASLASCPADGCVMVTGVMFELADDITADNPWLQPLFAVMPMSEGVSRASKLYVCLCFCLCTAS